MTTRTLVGSVIALMVAIALTPVPAAAIRLEEVLSGLSKPVFVTNAGDGSGRLFVLERGGVIKVLRPGPGTPLPTVFLGIGNGQIVFSVSSNQGSATPGPGPSRSQAGRSP